MNTGFEKLLNKAILLDNARVLRHEKTLGNYTLVYEVATRKANFYYHSTVILQLDFTTGEFITRNGGYNTVSTTKNITIWSRIAINKGYKHLNANSPKVYNDFQY